MTETDVTPDGIELSADLAHALEDAVVVARRCPWVVSGAQAEAAEHQVVRNGRGGPQTW